jgi:hypothetical protein
MIEATVSYEILAGMYTGFWYQIRAWDLLDIVKMTSTSGNYRGKVPSREL